MTNNYINDYNPVGYFDDGYFTPVDITLPEYTNYVPFVYDTPVTTSVGSENNTVSAAGNDSTIYTLTGNNTSITLTTDGTTTKTYKVGITDFYINLSTQFFQGQTHTYVARNPFRRSEQSLQFTIEWPLQTKSQFDGFREMNQFHDDIIKPHNIVLGNQSAPPPMDFNYLNNSNYLGDQGKGAVETTTITFRDPDNGKYKYIKLRDNALDKVIRDSSGRILYEQIWEGDLVTTTTTTKTTPPKAYDSHIEYYNPLVTNNLSRDKNITISGWDKSLTLAPIHYQGWIQTVNRQYDRFKNIYSQQYIMNIIPPVDYSSTSFTNPSTGNIANRFVPQVNSVLQSGPDWVNVPLNMQNGIKIDGIPG